MISDSEIVPVTRAGARARKTIGHIWKEGPRNWVADLSANGMGWDHIDTRDEAIALLRSEDAYNR